MIGKPGALTNERTRFDGGVYRYHPIRRIWEPFADGTTNPWGIDWDDYGQAFVCNCVDPHLYHVIQGAHYEPWRNRESSRYAYARLATIADHRHFVGIGNAESLGGVETLTSHPASMTHASVPAAQRAELGITDGLVRISAGIEDLQDLLDDIARALAAL